MVAATTDHLPEPEPRDPVDADDLPPELSIAACERLLTRLDAEASNWDEEGSAYGQTRSTAIRYVTGCVRIALGLPAGGGA